MHPTVPPPGRTSLRQGVRGTAVALVLGLGLAGCGSDTSPAADATSSSSAPSGSAAPSGSPSGAHTGHGGGHGDSPEESPSPSAAADATLAVQVRGDEVTPLAEQVDLAVGETLLVTVDADRAGELHVHADPEQLLEFDSGTAEFEVTLETPGSVDIEEHSTDALVARVLVR